MLHHGGMLAKATCHLGMYNIVRTVEITCSMWCHNVMHTVFPLCINKYCILNATVNSTRWQSWPFSLNFWTFSDIVTSLVISDQKQLQLITQIHKWSMWLWLHLKTGGLMDFDIFQTHLHKTHIIIVAKSHPFINSHCNCDYIHYQSKWPLSWSNAVL